jgi:hypothetical protein
VANRVWRRSTAGTDSPDVVKLVRVRQVRGAVEHFYTATVRITVTQELLDASRAESQPSSN